MKVYLLNNSDIVGGASRAAYRIHHAMRQKGIDSTMYVNLARAGDWTVQGPESKWAKAVARLRAPIGGLFKNTFRTSNPIIHSPACLPSNWSRRLNASDADVIHLHWVNGEMMSIEDIGRIEKPLVWTLHDMWAFCGAEHVAEDFRWRKGYMRTNRPDYESGFDLNRWVWKRKRKAWSRPMQIVTPSHWLANCVHESVLMRDWPVSVIPNTLDTEVWRPMEMSTARQILGLPADGHLLLFGTFGENSAPHKGFDLLQSALKHLHDQMDGLQLVVFGQNEPRKPIELGFPTHYMGHLHDDVSLRMLYNAVDVLVIPSRKDNLPNTGVEAMACGTPVVAFDTCGLPDLVKHQETGYLAKAFNTEDLARGVQWVLQDSERYAKLSTHARDDAVARFSYPVVARQYMQVYESAMRLQNLVSQ